MLKRVVMAAMALLPTVALFAADVAPIAMFADFENLPSATSISEMEQEVSAILKPSGLQISWHSLKDRKVGESFPDLVVLRFRGSCQVTDSNQYSELRPGMEVKTLAFTAISDGQILPFTDIFCDQVRRYIGPNITETNLMKRDTVYGRALGRVVAHELYHILVKTTEHSKSGVACSVHTRKDLTNSAFRFHDQEISRLREVSSRMVLASEGEPVVTSGEVASDR